MHLFVAVSPKTVIHESWGGNGSGSCVGFLPVMQETLFRSLGWEDPLEKGIATHSSILAWRIPWAEEPGGLQSIGSQESNMTAPTHYDP